MKVSMETLSTPILQRGDIIPIFTLPDNTGHLVSRTSYRGRKHLVLLCLADPMAAEHYLGELARVADTISAASGALLVIAQGSDNAVHRDRPPFPFPLLSDGNGATVARFLSPEVCNGLFVTDRYGELYYQALADSVDDLPRVSEIVDWVEAIDNQCSI